MVQRKGSEYELSVFGCYKKNYCTNEDEWNEIVLNGSKSCPSHVLVQVCNAISYYCLLIIKEIWCYIWKQLYITCGFNGI